MNRGRQELLRNFKYIVLDKKAIDKLLDAGIEYEQDRIRAVGHFEIDG